MHLYIWCTSEYSIVPGLCVHRNDVTHRNKLNQSWAVQAILVTLHLNVAVWHLPTGLCGGMGVFTCALEHNSHETIIKCFISQSVCFVPLPILPHFI